MATNVCPEGFLNRFFLSRAACEALRVEHGIDLIQLENGGGYRINRKGRNALYVSREVGQLIGPMIAMLDPDAASSIIRLFVHRAISNCYNIHEDTSWRAKARNLASSDPLRAVIMIAEHDRCEFVSLFRRVREVQKPGR